MSEKIVVYVPSYTMSNEIIKHHQVDSEGLSDEFYCHHLTLPGQQNNFKQKKIKQKTPNTNDKDANVKFNISHLLKGTPVQNMLRHFQQNILCVTLPQVIF